MFNQRIASIDASQLRKGQTISGDIVWNYFVVKKPECLTNWVAQYGDEHSAKIARLPSVLVQVKAWLERDRSRLQLPPLVMDTKRNAINVLTDEQASIYLNEQAFQGLRKHQRSTARLIAAVDDSQLSESAKRQHENRIRTHSWIAGSIQGSQKQLQVLKRAGKETPKIEPT